MEAEKIEIPDELKALNPESQKKPVVIGKHAYVIYPLTEGQVERLSQLISDIMSDIFTDDLVCSNCGHVFRDAQGKQETCNRCKGKNQLQPLRKSPIEALTHENRAMKFIEEMVGLKCEDVKGEITIPQFKHLAAVLYEQNFKDEGVLPEESRKNFKALLDWLGLGAQTAPKNATSASVKSTRRSPPSMGSPGSISGAGGGPGTEKEN